MTTKQIVLDSHNVHEHDFQTQKKAEIIGSIRKVFVHLMDKKDPTRLDQVSFMVVNDMSLDQEKIIIFSIDVWQVHVKQSEKPEKILLLLLYKW